MSRPLRLALVGSGIRTSMSPAFHKRAGALVGIEVSYDLIDLEPEAGPEMSRVLDDCKQRGYRALNVTYPFKEIAFGCVVVEDPSVRLIGAVNTVVFDGGVAVGSNSDFCGLLRRWRSRWPDVRPGIVALLGAGGVGKSVAFAMAELGATEIRIVDVDRERIRAVSDALRARFPHVGIVVAESAESAVTGATGVVNATPVGMYFEPGSPVDLDAISDQRWLFDVVYSPIETPLVARAEAEGLAVLNGFELFLGQALDAFERFTGRTLPDDAARLLEREMWERVAERSIGS